MIDRSSSSVLINDQQQQQPEPVYDVFLGGSCGNTCWRREIVIPYLKKRAISYYDPQRPAWSENMIQEEQRAKENSRIFLFVLDPGTINATSFLEIAYFAARKASKLVVVFLGKHEWSDQALRVDLPDRIRTCNLLEAILKRHSVLMLTSIEQAMDFVDAKIIGGKSFAEAMRCSAQRLPYLRLRARNCAHQCRERCRVAMRTCRTRVFTHLRRLILLLLFEAFLVFGFDFLLATSALSASISLWVLVLPLLAFNYLLLLGFIIYHRFKVHKRKRNKVLQCSLQMPMPPLPRVQPLPLTPEVPLTAAQRRERAFGATSVGKQSSGSTTSGNGAYEPLIELFIGTSSGRTRSNKKSEQYNSRKNEKRMEEQRRSDRVSPGDRLRLNGCLTSPVGYDVFLSCSSSSELDWITQKAVPELHKNGLSYTSALMCDNEAMRIPFLHTASHILYYIPSYKTFLSGMIEIAYFIGHADWQVTVCVPREAECLVLLDDAAKLDAEIRRAVERRNECYRMAFSYLKDMAARRQVRVFTRVEDAVRHIRDATQRGTGSVDLPDGTEASDVPEEMQPQQKRTALRQILEKQHLVKERTSQNLLAHLREAAARGQHLRLDPAEIRPDGELDMDPESLIIPVPESPIRS